MANSISISGFNYPPSFVFPDRVNIPREFQLNFIIDTDKLKYKRDELGRLSIIELSKAPFIKYDKFNWDYTDQDSKYKWYYSDTLSNITYRLSPKSGLIPLDLEPLDTLWTTYSSYISSGTLGEGYFDNESFLKVNEPTNPTGWIINDDPFPAYENYTKPTFSGLLSDQYVPIKLTVGAIDDSNIDKVIGIDKTFYKQNKISILDKNEVNNIQSLEYYFDGRNLVTNYDFEEQNIRDSIQIEYEYTVDKLKILTKLNTNTRGSSEYTPIIDNYVMQVSTQRIDR